MICATLNPVYISNLPILFLITLYCFQSFMEWKFDKESREYVISLGKVPLLVITGIILNFFFLYLLDLIICGMNGETK